MSNPYYNVSGTPATGSPGSSAPQRGEFAAIAAGFAMLPPVLTANAPVVVNSGGTGMTVSTTTGSGAFVLATSGTLQTPTLVSATLQSPTLVTPALGTPASGVLTNATGLPVATGISGLAAGVASALAAGVTGSGNVVLSSGATLAAPNLGNVASGNLANTTGYVASNLSGLGGGVALALATGTTGTNNIVLSIGPTLTLLHATGLPVSTGIAGLGTGVATALAAGVTGTGNLVLVTSPTLVTPILGTPSSVTLTNATGLPVSSGISGLGTGVAAAMANGVDSSGGLATYGTYLPLAGGTVTGGTTFSSSGVGLAVTNNATVGGTTTTTGTTFFGTGGACLINPNNGGNQVLQLASGEFLQYNTGANLTLTSTYVLKLTGSSVTINGSTAVTNNGGTYSINVTGNAGGVPWSGISGLPYAFNQDVDSGSNITWGSIQANGTINASGGGGASGSGAIWNGAGTTISGGPWSVAASIVGSNWIVAANGFANTSDKRKKTKIDYIAPESGATWVRNGKPCTFVMDGQKRAGFLAQDDLDNGRGEAIGFIADTDPRVAKSDGYAPEGHRLTRDYLHEIAYLTAALQAAFTRIEALEARA